MRRRVLVAALALGASGLALGALAAEPGGSGPTLAAGEPLEVTAPPGAPAGLLEALLDDDLGAGAGGSVPVALLEALVERDPERLGRTPDELYARFGFLVVRGHERPVGVTESTILGARFRTYNCLACHAGAEEGKLVVGAPNRALDFVALFQTVLGTARAIVRESDSRAEAILELERAARSYRHRHGGRLSPADAAVLAFTAEGLSRFPDRAPEPAYGPGRTVVTASYRRLRFHMDPGPYAPVKAPDLFGVAARTNLLWTGNEKYDPGTSAAERIARNGLLVPWVQPDPLTHRPPPDDEIVARLDRHRRMADLLARAAPPPAPAPADRALHARGKAVFEATCARCHGRYEQAEQGGRLATRVLSYDEHDVPLEKVGTDPAYDEANDMPFVRAIAATPIGALYKQIAPGHTYVARPLLGLRLRFPYLHNASVPSLAALLAPPGERPASFWVGADATVDRDACGYSGERTGPRALRRETTTPGNRAIGHPFGTTLAPEEKRALVEYLKTL